MNTITYDDAIQRLKKWRDHEGSQKRLALKLKVTDPYLSDILSGRRDLSPRILAALKLEKITTVTYREVENAKG